MKNIGSTNFLKIGLSLVLIAAFNLSSKAQEKDFRLGLHFSPNFDWFKADVDGIENDGSVINYSYGLITEFNFGSNNNYAVSTGFSIFNQSGAIKGDDGSKLKQSLQYIELPAVMKLKSNEIGYFTYFGKFGLSNKFNIAAERELDGPTIEKNTETNKSDVIFYNASLVVGFGAEYNLSGNLSLLAGLDFHNGFINVYDKASNIGDVKPFNITLNLGVMF